MKTLALAFLVLLAAGLCAAATEPAAKAATKTATSAPAASPAPASQTDDSSLKTFVETQLDALRKQFQERENTLQRLETALNELKNSPKQPAADAFRAVTDAMERAVQALKAEHGGKISNLENSLKSLSQQLESKVSSVVADVQKNIEQVKNSFSSPSSTDKKGTLEQEVASLKQSLQQLQDKFKNQTAANELFESLKVTVNSLYQWGKQQVLKAWAFINENLLNKTTTDAVIARFEECKEYLLRLFDKSIDFLRTYFLSIPALQPYAPKLALGTTAVLFALPVLGVTILSKMILSAICCRKRKSSSSKRSEAKSGAKSGAKNSKL